MSNSIVSRSFYNEEASEKAYQRQVRESAKERYKGKEWWPENPDLSTARVRETKRPTAKKIIREYEWLGTLPNASRFYGIFFRGENENKDPWACGGVTCWSDQAGGGTGVHEMFGIERDELAYLQRGANTHWSPPNANSKLISYSLGLETEVGKKVAIAYSDRDAGEIGTVYQATGWYCLGPGGSIAVYLHPETGKPYDQKVVYNMLEQNGLKGEWTWKQMRNHMIEQGWERKKTTPKYRYAKILATGEEERQIYNNIKNKVVGYPKRERDIIDGDVS